ncbi:MAG: DUF4159 domain-containing protein [Verrucomicrobiales bacterium]
MNRGVLFILIFANLFMAHGQFRGRGGNPRSSYDLPTWEAEPQMKKDVFTFARVRYSSRWRSQWRTDYPESDYNFSFRLQQMTSLKVNPEPVIIQLTDENLHNYPWIYIIEPGNLEFTEEEAMALRAYLLNGGFLMVDDFWGEDEYANFYDQIKRVFPEREPTELDISHPIFNIVFPLSKKPQVPSINRGMQSQWDGITWERHDAQEVHYKGIFDDKQRLMVIICHNTDLGDGWEREGENEYYFREFSEKSAYPMGINIVFYAMTH